MTTATLYERLGQSQGISTLVDDIVQAHMENPTIKPRFLPYADEPERLAVIKTHLYEFLSAGSGGPDEYTGASMIDTHRGMNISAEEYMAAADDILEVLERHDIDQQTRNEVLGIVWSLKPEIVRL